MTDGKMVTVRLAYSRFEFAVEGLARYLENPRGDDVGRNTSHLSKQVEEAVTRLRAQRKLLNGPDDAEPRTDLLDALVLRN